MTTETIKQPLSADNRMELLAAQRTKSARSRNQLFVALAFLLPNLTGFLAFTFLPVLISFWMSFTNWSLKPAVKFQYVGLRNFVDLLGFRPITQDHPILLVLYATFVLLFLFASIFSIWINMAQSKGTRLGGVVLAVAGVGFVFVGLCHASDGIIIASLVAVVCGMIGVLRDSDFTFGFGTLPSAVLALSALIVYLLQPSFSANYTPNDTYFYQYLYNTLYLMLGIPLSIGGSLVVALLLNEDLPTGPARERLLGASTCAVIGAIIGGLLWFNGHPDTALVFGIFWLISALAFGFNVVVYRTIFYLPTFTAGVALMILWKALYNPRTGPIDGVIGYLFGVLHIHAAPPHWLGDVRWAKPAMIIMGVWTGIGGTNMLLYLSALSNLPKELIEAAKVDGAGWWAQFRNVVWPQLAPTTFFISVMSIIGGLQGGFDQAKVMTNGGPAGATTTLGYYIYLKAFSELDMGYAAAISWILFLIIFIATSINWKYGKGLDGA